MIEALLSDRLWIYTSIIGALLGAAFLAYFKGTRAGVWAYVKFDQTLDFMRDRYGWTWFDQPADAWKKIHPGMAKEIEELNARIAKLEGDKNGRKET